MAEYVSKVHAIRMHCGSLASFSHRKTLDTELILLGETESYEPLCRSCFDLARNAQRSLPMNGSSSS